MTLLGTIGTLTLIGAVAGLLLGWARRRFVHDEGALIPAIDAALPQTQCGQCGYPGCLPYARAVAAGERIDRCPPGGDALVRELAELLGRSESQVDPALPQAANQVARIDEARCIGCGLCLPACPVDAIIGAPRYLHTVIVADCTGCELCIAPCPVDCIDLIATTPSPEAWRWPKP